MEPEPDKYRDPAGVWMAAFFLASAIAIAALLVTDTLGSLWWLGPVFLLALLGVAGLATELGRPRRPGGP